MSDGMKRRDFLKVLGATGAGAATAGCSTGEVERLIPYVIPAEEITPGVPTWYTSTCRECPAGCGIHVETHSGRATKVEGNPDHPVNRGNLCARGQASVQGLYHPDRFRGPIIREPGVRDTDVTWGTAERELATRIREAQQAGRGNAVVFLTQDYTGTKEALVNAFVGAIGARRVIYDEWQDQPRNLDFSNADFLISFGADFLETWGSPVDYSGQFAEMHSYRDGRRGKFVWVGPHRPLTGVNADQWVAPRPGTEVVLARALAGQVDAAAASQATEIPQEVIAQLVQEFRAGNGVALGPGPAIAGTNQSELRAAINALNGGRVNQGNGQGRGGAREVLQLIEQMRAGQVDVLLIDSPNPAYTLAGSGFAEALQQVRTRVSFSPFPDETALHATLVLPDHHFLEAWDDYVPEPSMFELIQPTMRPVFNTKQTGDVLLSVARELGTDIGGGASTYYDYLRTRWAGISGGGEGWRDALKRGGVLPESGRAGFDARTNLENAAGGTQGTGAAGFVPLVGGASAAQVTAGAAEARQQSNIGTSGQTSTLPQADVAQTQGTAPAPAGIGAGSGQPLAFEGPEGANLHLVVYPSYRFFDGRTANRPWLLELPDPVTKVVWDSWVEIHPRTASEMGIEQGDVIDITSQYGTVQTFAYVWPGVRPDTVAIQAGLGHEAFGRYTEGRGANPYRLLGPNVDATSGRQAHYGLRVAVNRVSGPPDNGVANPGPGLFEYGKRVQDEREIARAISVTQLAALQQSAGEHAPIPGEEEHIEPLKGGGGFVPVETTTDPAAYPGPGTHYGQYIENSTRWAMVIDLQRCIGCSACVTACYAENNIPVVGPSEFKRGRELAWLRIERYWGVTQDEEEALADEAPNDTRFLPMLCQHCGNAPCEPVCPVYAAYHTPDGLNGQVYNRCVGTRYCANNCPYKVRVFNWWTYDFAEPLNWQLNPDVAVREKGVMEKCTFCVQRIREGHRQAALEERPLRDGDVVPACVQTCPTEVFVFGNIQDPESQVAQAARSVRGYRTLDVTNAQPAIVYLSKVTLHEPATAGHHAPAEAGEAAGAAAH